MWHWDAHHIVPWQEGGPTHTSNLVALCRVHHTLLEPAPPVRRADGSLEPSDRRPSQLKSGCPRGSAQDARGSGPTYGVLDQGDDGRAHAELPDAQADEGGGEVGVAREVAAHGDGLVPERRTGHEDQGPDRGGGA